MHLSAVAFIAISPLFLSSASVPTADPWFKVAHEEYARVTTDLARSILGDGTISAAEYDSAVSELQDCARKQGAEIFADPAFGLWQLSAEGEIGDRAFKLCSSPNFDAIERIYVGRYRDPEMKGDSVIWACLIRIGAVRPHESYSVEALDAVLGRLDSTSEGAASMGDACVMDPLGHSW